MRPCKLTHSSAPQFCRNLWTFYYWKAIICPIATCQFRYPVIFAIYCGIHRSAIIYNSTYFFGREIDFMLHCVYTAVAKSWNCILEPFMLNFSYFGIHLCLAELPALGLLHGIDWRPQNNFNVFSTFTELCEWWIVTQPNIELYMLTYRTPSEPTTKSVDLHF